MEINLILGIDIIFKRLDDDRDYNNIRITHRNNVFMSI